MKRPSETIRNLFVTNMSERAGKILRDDMEDMGPVRMRDVDESQTYLVNTAKDLAEREEIVIAANNEEDELVY